MSTKDLLSTRELSFAGHKITGALSRTESEATSNNRLVDTERKIKHPGGKPKSLEDAFSSRSLISISYEYGERGEC